MAKSIGCLPNSRSGNPALRIRGYRPPGCAAWTVWTIHKHSTHSLCLMTSVATWRIKKRAKQKIHDVKMFSVFVIFLLSDFVANKKKYENETAKKSWKKKTYLARAWMEKSMTESRRTIWFCSQQRCFFPPLEMGKNAAEPQICVCSVLEKNKEKRLWKSMPEASVRWKIWWNNLIFNRFCIYLKRETSLMNFWSLYRRFDIGYSNVIFFVISIIMLHGIAFLILMY